MTAPLPEAEVRRIYMDALERAVRHAAVHVARGEALEIGHHVAAGVVHRCMAEGANSGAGSRPGAIAEIDAFVRRAVLNRLREIWRARQRRTAAERAYQVERSSVAPAWAQPGADLESRELHAAIEAAIEGLPETQRKVFLLIRRDQRSYKEVASQLGIAVGTVHTHLSRANAALRDAVADFQRADNPGTIGRPSTARTGT